MAAATRDPRSNSVGSMRNDVERIKQDLMATYEDGRPIDIADWVTRYPDYRDEILSFWMWLSGTPRLHEIQATSRPEPNDRISGEAIRQACLAVSFGPQWLKESFDPDPAIDETLGVELARIRAKAYRFQGKASKAFRKGVILAWVVQKLAVRRKQVTRLAAQKAVYVLERALNLGVFTDHQQKPLGPYDHRAKYHDAEPIAARGGWMRVSGSVLEPGERTEEITRYLGRYIRSEPLASRLIDLLARLTDEELEVWATIAWAARALASSGEPVTVSTVQDYLAQSTEWSAKLRRRSFRPGAIAGALTRLSRLRLLEG